MRKGSRVSSLVFSSPCCLKKGAWHLVKGFTEEDKSLQQCSFVAFERLAAVSVGGNFLAPEVSTFFST